MSNRRKVFFSYHHSLDETYKTKCERVGSIVDVLVPGSVNDGDIDSNRPGEAIRQKIRDEYLRDSSVTVVLIGAETWQRNHIYWEIGSAIRHTEYDPRSGLLGILLPAYPRTDTTKYNPRTSAPRLYENIKCECAAIYNWSDDPTTVQDWIHQAYLRKSAKQPDNSRAPFGKNRTGSEWTD